jgi:hypothetical protein
LCGWQVDDYLVRAREAFSKQIILAVGCMLGGGSSQEQEETSNQQRDEKSPLEIGRPPPFPPWLGRDGVRCVQDVMQQQVKPPSFDTSFFDFADGNEICFNATKIQLRINFGFDIE